MLDNPEAEAKLTALLKETGEAHHKYEQEKLAGKTDENWANWYVEYLIAHGITDYFEEEIVKEDLAEDLKAAAAKFNTDKPDLTWQEYYAKFMIYDYT